MKRLRRALLVAAIGMAALVPGPVAGDETTAEPAAAAIGVSPDAGLTDGQLVDVTGSGFGVSTFFYECPATSTALESCTHLSVPFGSGPPGRPGGPAFAASVHVEAVLEQVGGTTFDCRVAAGACVLDVRSVEEGLIARAPLSFDPSAPLEPPPTLTVTPSADLEDGQIVDAVVTGLHANTEANASQCAGNEQPRDPCALLLIESAWADASGNLRLRLHVGTRLQGVGGPVDCRAATCSLVMGGSGRFGAVPIHFQPAPNAPIEPRSLAPLAARPAFTG